MGLPTDQRYAKFARQTGFIAKTIQLPHAEGHGDAAINITRAHWLGAEDAEYIIIYFHGEGLSARLRQT